MRIRESVLAKLALIFVVATIAVGIVIVCTAPQAHSQLDRYFPYPPVWCPGGGISTSWGGYCNGQPYPDGTQWHQDAYWAPFVGRVWNPIVCVVANTPAPPPLAGSGGCGGFVA